MHPSVSEPKKHYTTMFLDAMGKSIKGGKGEGHLFPDGTIKYVTDDNSANNPPTTSHRATDETPTSGNTATTAAQDAPNDEK